MAGFISFIVITSYLLKQQVIKNSKTEIPELELFPRYLLFLRQQPATRTQQSNIWVNMGMMSLRVFPQHLPRGNLRMQQEYHAFPWKKLKWKPICSKSGATILIQIFICFHTESENLLWALDLRSCARLAGVEAKS